MERYVHTGSDHFDITSFLPIQNIDGWVKPKGGLWASPVNAPYSWSKWKKDNNFNYQSDDSFKFTLTREARVLKIYKASQLDALPIQNTNLPHNWKVLDFEKLAESYDAMLVMISNDNKLYWDLYGWDCDTLLVFNPDVVKEEV